MAPQDVSSLRSFLGLTGFSRDFIERYSVIAKLLYHLLKKDIDWTWEEPQQRTFAKLKRALASALVFAYPKEGTLFILQLSATTEGISAVLNQNCGTGKKSIAYKSRNLSEVEKRLTP